MLTKYDTDAAMQSAGFPSNDNRNNNNTNSTNPLHLNRHIPSNSNSNSSYPAVTVSGGQGLNSGPVLPVLRDVPFGTNFSVPDHGDDGGLSPIFLEGYAHGADGIAQYLEQRRDAPDFHQHLQSFGGGVDHNVHADCVAASGNQLNLDSLTAHSLCSHGSSKCSRNPSLMGTASNSSTTSPSSRPSTNSTDFHPSQNSSTRRGTTKNQRHNSNASTARTVDSLSIDDDGSPETSAALSTRIAAAIKSIRLLGFSGIEELTAQFYTADLNDLPALADAQRASRRRELARMLSQIRENANDGWSDWETHGYREEIVHAAEEILSDECRRFLEEHENATGGKGAKSRQQLKRQFQDEVSFGKAQVYSNHVYTNFLAVTEFIWCTRGSLFVIQGLGRNRPLCSNCECD